MNEHRFTPRLTGHASRRVHGLVSALRERAVSARAAAVGATDERAAAALRGKAVAYDEAARMADAVERGWLMPWRRREYRRRSGWPSQPDSGDSYGSTQQSWAKSRWPRTAASTPSRRLGVGTHMNSSEPESIVDLLMRHGCSGKQSFRITDDLLPWMRCRPALLAAWFPGAVVDPSDPATVEAAARALYERDYGFWPPRPGNTADTYNVDQCRSTARCVLAAIATPTDTEGGK